MKQVFLPAADPQLIQELQNAMTMFLRDRCMLTRSNATGIHWDMTFSLNVFYRDATGMQMLAIRPNDTIGDEITAPSKPEKKKPKRKVLTDKALKVLEGEQNWKRTLAKSAEQPENELRPDSFRYREREEYDKGQ